MTTTIACPIRRMRYPVTAPFLFSLLPVAGSLLREVPGLRVQREQRVRRPDALELLADLRDAEGVRLPDHRQVLSDVVLVGGEVSVALRRLLDEVVGLRVRVGAS